MDGWKTDDGESNEDVVEKTSSTTTHNQSAVGKLADHYPHYALMEIKFWISQQSVIPELSDHIIQVFLHSCYYNLQNTKSTILSFYNLRMKLPQVFSDRNMDFIKSASNNLYCVKLPGVTHEEYKVFYLRLCDVVNETANFSFTNLSKFVLMAAEMWIFLEDTYPGVIFVLDSRRFTFSHLKHINVATLRPIFQYCQDALAARVKKIIILNVSTPVDIVLSMVELIIGNKLMNLIEKYGKGNTKYLDSIPENILPKECGGKCEKDIDDLQRETIEHLEKNLEWFAREDDILKNLMAKHQPRRRRSIFENIFNGSSAVPT